MAASIEFQQAIGIAIGARLKAKLRTLGSVLLKDFLMRHAASCLTPIRIKTPVNSLDVFIPWVLRSSVWKALRPMTVFGDDMTSLLPTGTSLGSAGLSSHHFLQRILLAVYLRVGEEFRSSPEVVPL